MPFLTNSNASPGGKVQILVVGQSSDAFEVTEFDDTESNEVTTELYISKIISSGAVEVQRGANTIWQAADGDVWDFDRMGTPLKLYPTANVEVIVPAGDTALVELKKRSTWTGGY